MIRMLAFVAVTIPLLTVEAWGKHNAFERKQITEYVTKLCTKNSAEDKVPQVLDAIENFEKCSVSLFKDEVLLEEVAVAIRSNDLNGVFKKYCARTPRLAKCTYSVIDSVGLCVTGVDLPAAHNFVDQLLGFVCHNDGERIGDAARQLEQRVGICACIFVRNRLLRSQRYVQVVWRQLGCPTEKQMFIQEGGPQCFQQNIGNLNICASKVLSELDATQPAKERCNRFDDLSRCTVDTLKTCSILTPANMTLDLFGHLRQATPCAANDDVFRTYRKWLQGREHGSRD